MALHPPTKPAAAMTVVVGSNSITIGKSYVRGRALVRARSFGGRFVDVHPTEQQLGDIIDAAVARREAMRREAAAAAGGGS